MLRPLDLSRPGAVTLAGVPDGLDGLCVADLARQSASVRRDRSSPDLLVVARDAERMVALADQLAFYGSEQGILTLPAWDCMPYDRVGPSSEIAARRLAALSRLARFRASRDPTILITSINAIVQRVPTRAATAAEMFSAAPGNVLPFERVVRWLEDKAFLRTATVREPGEYAVRGGILDLFAPGTSAPVRLDFFGDTLESIRTFDPETQRSTGTLDRLDLVPSSEVLLDPVAVRRFRERYVEAFGVAGPNDLIYTSVSEGLRVTGIEHWLPLFHERLETIFDYMGDVPVVLEPLVEEAIRARLAEIQDHFEARQAGLGSEPKGAPPYRPVKPSGLYLSSDEIAANFNARPLVRLNPFLPEEPGPGVIDLGGRYGRTFAAERADEKTNVFDAVVAHVQRLQKTRKKVALACWTEGSRDRMRAVLSDHGLKAMRNIAGWAELGSLAPSDVGLAILALESGFETPSYAVIAEQDILGERLVRSRRKRKRAQDFLNELTALSEGDLVVHIEYGIGRFRGLKTLEAQGAPRDFADIEYAEGATLYLPIENLELLSRYGSEETAVQLDRLGGAGWQQRKARLKERLREIAAKLIAVAAARMLRDAPVITPPDGAWDEFCARFPYEETEDQDAAIEAVLEDLASGRPMDRLICGDVGFGKTEVALRAAFMVAMSGKQVAVVVPTTLLARQHHKTFSERFHGFPLKVKQISRLVPQKEVQETKAGLRTGDIDIVIGTHALLGRGIAFRDLGLLVVDEEQHFGVAHKERLKEMRAEVHILTMTATPIPRTLQLALSGVRELSIIATPPVDRLAIRTFITPFDPLSLREALLRERYRGGQAFYVVPRISDLAEIREFVEEQVPEVKVAIAHGQMPPAELEEIMSAFYDGKSDVLLSTTIVESGLDIPTANTLIVHRADMFGLAQLYQLRGRVGRAKARAYALLTIPPDRRLTASAEKRLKVLQSLDSLGAGFQLASHDLDIRGAGNLLGEEQSGHIREVGYELYQSMLEETVASLRAGETPLVGEQWSPQITIGAPVLIPEDYVRDLSLRMSLYRRLAQLEAEEDIIAFGAELGDRFGPLPEEVEALLKIVGIKGLCRRAHVEKIDAGPKGIVIGFRENKFPHPEALVRYIASQGEFAKIRPDHKLVLRRDWASIEERLQGVTTVLRQLAGLAEGKRLSPEQEAELRNRAPAASGLQGSPSATVDRPAQRGQGGGGAGRSAWRRTSRRRGA